MSCTPNYTEWTREQKEELAERRMREMREKNEKLLKRYAEVENDRIEAESRNSAVTNAPKAAKKETNRQETYKTESRIEHAREWDRGKPDKDNWKSPDHHGSFKNYRTGRHERKEVWNNSSRNDPNDSWHDHTSAGHQDRKEWGNYTRNESSDHYRYGRTSETIQNRKARGNYRYKQYEDQQNMSRLHRSPKRARGVGYRYDLYRNSKHSYSDERYKQSDNRSNLRKKYSYRAHSRSSSRSESDFLGNNTANISSMKISSLWQNDKISEDQNKQNRVEKWVDSVNKSNWGRGKPFPNDQKEKNRSRSYSKCDRYERSSPESSPENKSRENINMTSYKSEYHLSKRQNTGPLPENVGSSSLKQTDRVGFKTRRNPQYNSVSTGKNDHFRKRRFDNKGFKTDEQNKFVKPVIHDNNDDSWNNSAIPNRSMIKEKNSDFDRAGTWNQGNDSWGPAVQCHVDDGWENADQSDIKWKLSDEETNLQESKNTNIEHVSTKKISDDMWKDFACNEKLQLKGNYQYEKQVALSDDPDGTWAHFQPDQMNLKLAGSKNEGKGSCSLNEISEKLEKNCKITDKMEIEETVGKMPKSSSNLVIEVITLDQSSGALSEKSQEKNAGGSDGWSTVSEEGEIHTDEDNEWKKDTSAK